MRCVRSVWGQGLVRASLCISPLRGETVGVLFTRVLFTRVLFTSPGQDAADLVLTEGLAGKLESES
jgi:hypothetical protein